MVAFLVSPIPRNTREEGFGREHSGMAMAMAMAMARPVRAMARPGFGKGAGKASREVRRDLGTARPTDPEEMAFEARLERLRRTSQTPRTSPSDGDSTDESAPVEREKGRGIPAAAFPAFALLLAGAFAWTFAFGDGPAAPPPSKVRNEDVEALPSSPTTPFGRLRATTEALCEAGKQDEALAEVERVASDRDTYDPLSLLLLKASVYSGWDGHAADAAALYDKAVDEYNEDFRAYLARGAFLQIQGQKGEAQRMFIQARFYAPTDAKAFVNRVASR